MPKAPYLFFSVVLSVSLSFGKSAAASVYPADSLKVAQDTLPSSSGTSATPIDTGETSPAISPSAPSTGFVLKPIIGLGVGMFSYYGNIKSANSYAQNPMSSRLGYSLVYAQKLSDHFEFNLYALFGRLGVYQRSLKLNWNFESNISGGGIHIMYKILPKQAITPYVLTGIESFEYLSKTDMYDKYGNKYYYWSDGSVRSLPQNAPNASNATIIQPDFSYETDIRSLNLDGSGKYSEQTFAIPVGAGILIHFYKKADLMLGTTLHYTFTDHIDGLQPGDPGAGNVKHDMFLMTSVGLRFDLSSAKHMKGPGEEDQDRYDSVDFAGLMNNDEDNDGVKDWADSCPGTPPGVAVDAKGCPVDGDNDGIPDYRDKQLETPADSIGMVNTDGVAMTAAMMLKQYQIYMDSTGRFSNMIYDSSSINGPGTGPHAGVKYMVKLGKYSKGVPADVMDKFLSVPDVKSTMLKDSSSVYTAGEYSDFNVAKKRQEDLIKQGITDAKIVYLKGDDFVATDKPVAAAKGQSVASTQGAKEGTQQGKNGAEGTKEGTQGAKGAKTNGGNETLPPADAVVYRVQLGAYKHKLTRNIFSSVSNLVEMKTENGFFTYSAGSFTNYNDAAVYKTQLATQGFSDAFIKAYKNGKRIPLSKAGATYVKPVKENLNDSVTHEINTLDKKQISFKVQLGAFKGTPPKELADKFKEYKNLTTWVDESGLTHYAVGPYTDYNKAKAMKEKVQAAGIKGAFVVAFFKDKTMPVQQAISILKQ